jgi:hypothetical protein
MSKCRENRKKRIKAAKKMKAYRRAKLIQALILPISRRVDYPSVFRSLFTVTPLEPGEEHGQ